MTRGPEGPASTHRYGALANRRVRKRRVDQRQVSSASVMVGGALLGVVGAVLAVPIAGSVKVILRHATDGRRQRSATLETAAARPHRVTRPRPA